MALFGNYFEFDGNVGSSCFVFSASGAVSFLFFFLFRFVFGFTERLFSRVSLSLSSENGTIEPAINSIDG